MKIDTLTLILLAAALSAGCFAPINATYESARLLDKGQFSLQGSYTSYMGSTIDDGFENINNNLGFALGYGISDRFDLKLRYEHLDPKVQTIELFDEEYDFGDINYIELSGKFQIRQDKMALSVPVGVYLHQEGSLFALDPRFFFTFGSSDKFEVSVIPKAQILVGDGAGIFPGVILGCGFSSDLNKWAIRPEIGYDGILNFGVGMNFNL